MTQFISHIHEEVRAARLTRRGATHRAEDVPRGLNKAYPRMEQFVLPEPAPLGSDLAEVLLKRASCNTCSADTSLSLADCGSLFGHALRKHPDSLRRNYPSGGALYPVETYLISHSLEGSEPAVFHYNPTLHTLEKLWSIPANFDMKTLARFPEDLYFSNLIVFTAVWKRSSAKYGDLTYSHALLEAGHMSENMLLVATALGLNTRPMAGFDDHLVLKLLDIDPEEEAPIHSIVLCR